MLGEKEGIAVSGNKDFCVKSTDDEFFFFFFCFTHLSLIGMLG
jgi:hypothetical protein